MRVKLERVKNGVALRTSEVVGAAETLPIIGEKFIMTAPPLDPEAGNMRLVATSPVVGYNDAHAGTGASWQITFRTENSIYRLTRLPDAQ